MATFDDVLVAHGYDIFEEARKLSEEESQRDPENDPFRSKYRARELLQGLKERVDSFRNEEPDDAKLLCAAAVIELILGINCSDTEEFSEGETHLKKCLELIETIKHTEQAAGIYQSALNQIGVTATGRFKNDEALKYLREAESCYKYFIANVGNSPHSATECFEKPNEDENDQARKRLQSFEKEYTHTLYYIAQVFAKMGEKEESAKYCHITLKRQLNAKDYKPLDWSLNAATLSQYYINVDDFTRSRHCLASASVIFDEVMSTINDIPEDDREKIMQQKADIDRCWAKYGLALLEVSKDQWLKETDSLADNLDDKEDHNADLKQSSAEVEGATAAETHEEQVEDKCDPLDVEKTEASSRFDLELTYHEEQITDKHVHDFTEAREGFLCIQKWLNSAKEFYVCDGYCTDYIEIMRDYSLAFKLLSVFEPDMERQCKMHKRRIDILSETLDDLNPQHYLLVCRQLMFELGETYSTMMDLKLALMESQGTSPAAHAIKKVNSLIENSIKQYRAYTDSLKGGKPDLPEEFPEMDVRPALVAFFCMGRLHSKFITSNPDHKLAFLKSSCECYKTVVDYVDRNPSAKEIVSSELPICQDMVILLPAKMEKIRERLV